MKNYVEYIKDFIKNELPKYEGNEVYGCELANLLTEKINVNGTVTFDRSKAMEYVKECFF